MRYIYSLFVFLVMITKSEAQSIERQVIGGSGMTLTNGTTSIDFTVGELSVTTITDGTITLTQGFHQASVLLGIKINPIVFLQGALLNTNSGEDNLMRDDLRINYLPLISPYSDGLVCDVSVFSDGGTNGSGLTEDNIVDWVYVELRDKTDNTLIKTASSALLQRDGNIVGVDGVSNLELPVQSDDYYVVIRHRNHLSVMSLNTISLSNTVTNVDFSDSNNSITFGTNAQSTFGMPSGIFGMWSGNVNGDTQIRYQGSANDSNSIKDDVVGEVGNTTNSNLYQYYSYNNADVDMNGTISYQGSGNDSNYIKDIIVSHPDNTSNSNLFLFSEQLPEN